MIKIKVKKDSEWNEYLVICMNNGKANKDLTYHTDDAQDAADTAVATIETYPAELNDDKYTVKFMSKYRPDFLIAQARKAIKQ